MTRTGRPSVAPMLMALAALCLAVSAFPALAGQPVQRDDLTAIFREQDAVGTFVLYDVAADQLTLVNASRAAAPFVPASTFKIPNSLIALETGAVKDENEVIPYGGKSQPVKAWERDMPMREAIVASNVPVYQELARRIGLVRYAEWLARLEYGNRETGSDVENFWLDGPLRISAIEQVKFLARLAEGRLEASPRHLALVRSLLLLESGEGMKLYGKTGWQPPIGWWVGWIERNGRIFTFALNMDLIDMADAPKRITIGKALLAKLGVL